jgi:hypothetical protein
LDYELEPGCIYQSTGSTSTITEQIITLHSNIKDPTRRLKVAYVSPDLDGTHAGLGEIKMPLSSYLYSFHLAFILYFYVAVLTLPCTAVARFAWAALDLDKSKFELTVYNCKDFSKCKFEIFSMSHLVDRCVKLCAGACLDGIIVWLCVFVCVCVSACSRAGSFGCDCVRSCTCVHVRMCVYKCNMQSC